MFNTAKNVYKNRNTFAETRRDFDIIKGALDELPDPRREASFLDDLKGPVVVNGVKGFRCV